MPLSIASSTTSGDSPGTWPVTHAVEQPQCTSSPPDFAIDVRVAGFRFWTRRLQVSQRGLSHGIGTLTARLAKLIPLRGVVENLLDLS